MRVVVADLAAYERLYTDVLAALPGVDRVSTQIAMKVVKQAPGLPV
jgi:DNA-binding Lrp family transcriptional regulator